jgi:plasmid replication initiation protein
MQKTIFSAYISRHLAFPATDLCSESYYTLKNIKERLEMELSYVENAESKYETLNKILEKVNQYSSIETTFIKISHLERLHFSDM